MAGDELKGKKRKYRDSHSGDEKSVKILPLSESSLPPLVTTISGFYPPENTRFQLLKKSNQSNRDASLIGRTERVQFEAKNQSTATVEANYCLAVADKTGRVKKIVPAKYLNTFERNILALQEKDKFLKKKHGTVSGTVMEQRANLGLAFGTRKSQKAIMEESANRVKAETLGDVKDQLVSNVQKATEALPTQEDIAAAQAQDRPIPPVNVGAESIEDAYKLEDIIPKEEFSAIYIKPLLENPDERNWAKLLPYRHSLFINERFQRLLSIEEVDQKRARILYYISLLQAFLFSRRSVGNRETLRKKLADPPEILIDGLIKRFTQTTGIGSVQVSSREVDKIICYILVLCLIVDNYSTDVLTLANDLNVKTMKANELFRTVGCRIMAYTETQRMALGLNKTDAKNHKRAVLKIPLEFPKPRRGRARN
ncbi:DNA-directed RNA polymerase I complex subunit Rpa49 [Schizosaccharomyces pombe]|uniref:DNA-directed RNA polymerase I subunit rpa49 n=1 Tax=Schizosaccharomyces pombe (strain 972 / ATCC 24843) TaxID=284812 RepID=RPA49_SCHPO|nr:putative DNA-directed RNA polymerase I complex subunit Rpa49 [Schizosaccharomyces pombe]O14086.1 RecName: Full=DNA-directed RNA polymerase I subunit rpa49; Short=RNA polymerase I subunit A49; AltName: Full=DNA-directed RNA polymerase I 49 kDa polypeptide [Schizosaccharomyces pombe 972h-]CAB16261.1 DNA-directed RNA polymerase I complex subunit Rpa49 (predicted) [Schizosaccharomyces pombe]CAC20964.1 Rpa49 subunit specific to nuclear RNA polymerase I [Schizosaccharomyces pombe]|eukprot:NP_594382.1 putative DNA-directed RNA polymerase I complex subunit Rpa49 [Schizosaccharomyces pombe]